MRRLLLPFATLLLLATASACGGQSTDHATAVPATVSAGSTRFAGGELSPPSPTPDFMLRDQSGREVSMAAQRGKVVLVTFLYTHCPDVCPLIAQNLNTALGELGPKRREARVLAVSVDPEGDTRASVDAFAKAHHLVPEFHYLTGTRAQLEKVWKAYKVAAVARDPALVDHTAYTMLVDPAGKGRVIYDSGFRSAEIVHDIRLLLPS